MTGLAVLLTGLLIIGLSGSTWDVVMNVQGVEVERSFGRSIMPRFHAAFAAGTVAGAAVAIAMVARQVPVAVHLTLIAVIVALAVPLAARHYLTEPQHQQTSDKAIASTPRSGGSGLRAWGESRTLLIVATQHHRATSHQHGRCNIGCHRLHIGPPDTESYRAICP